MSNTAFTYNGIPSGIPTGSIMAYMGTSTIGGNGDPLGWVICDGQPRANGDGRYNALQSLGIGYFAYGAYFPPDFRGAFLRGTLNAGNANFSGGNNVGTVQYDQIINHKHGLGIPWSPYGGLVEGTSNYHMPSGVFGQLYTTYGVDNSYNGVIVNGGNETRPYNISVLWIAKI